MSDSPHDAETEPPDLNRPASASPTESQLEQSAAHDPYASLRLPNYRYYALGWFICVIGQQMQSVAIGWQLFNLAGGGRHGALAQGFVGGVQALPILLLALPAGQWADRFDRRLILICTQSFATLCSLGLAFASHHGAPPGAMYLLLGLSATAQAAGWPARSALLPQLVPPELIANATTWNSSGYQLAAVVGPALGGLVVSISVTAAYLIDAICALTFLLLLARLHPRPAARSREPASLASVLAGARFVAHNPLILATITLDLFAVLLGGATYLLPYFASDVLHVGAVGFGWLRAAPAFGAVAMAMLIAHRPPMRRAGLTLLWAVAAFGLATIGFGFSRWFLFSFVMLLLTGGFDNVSVVVRHTLVQMLTPEHMRGRVSAVNSIFIGASNEIGGLESGVTGYLFGPIVSVVAGGIGTLLVVLGVHLLWPQVQRIGSLNDLHPIQEPAA